MATNQEVTVRMTYWVDDIQERVVMAEASGEFVDILFSFLTLPLGTITRLQSENKFPGQLEIGCINNLYESVRDLSPDVFQNNMCQKMLLSPRNPLEGHCQRLKLKVDDTPPTKYFVCPTTGCNLLVSTFEGATCSCGVAMNNEMKLLEEGSKEGENGVFVRGDAMFLICDDLTVLPSSPGNAVLLLRNYQLNVRKDRNCQLDARKTHQNVGMDKILRLLKQALTSQTPLTDVFLNHNQISARKTTPSYPFSRCTAPSNNFKGSVEIKVIMSKSENKIKFAETDGDFVDFLVSFLTTSLGSILNLMNGRVSLGSIPNLYASVKNLDSSCFIGSSKKSLLNPGVAPQFGCKSIQVSALQEVNTPKYWYGTVKGGTNSGEKKISKIRDMLRDPAEMKLFEPRCCDGARERAIGFMKRPCTFVVSDDLEVKTIANGTTSTTNATTSATNATTSTTSSIEYLHQQIEDRQIEHQQIQDQQIEDQQMQHQQIEDQQIEDQHIQHQQIEDQQIEDQQIQHQQIEDQQIEDQQIQHQQIEDQHIQHQQIEDQHIQDQQIQHQQIEDQQIEDQQIEDQQIQHQQIEDQQIQDQQIEDQHIQHQQIEDQQIEHQQIEDQQIQDQQIQHQQIEDQQIDDQQIEDQQIQDQQIQKFQRDGLSGLRTHSVKITKSHKALNLLMASLTTDKAVLTRNLFYPIKWKIQRFVLFWKKKKEKLWKKLKPNFFKCVK
ncbi:hypothetical protein Fmac_010490 [Flemingia macrophylla]|uniref:Uncharacterized protein n=1 Tax=Flemingia macrophylla TaxID=520843 RepID=A0ABD1MJQ6_9FABA